MNVSDDNIAPERFLGSYVSASTFTLLRVQPVLGRDFTRQDDVPVLHQWRSWLIGYGVIVMGAIRRFWAGRFASTRSLPRSLE